VLVDGRRHDDGSFFVVEFGIVEEAVADGSFPFEAAIEVEFVLE
jgi:hypothetical protein